MPRRLILDATYNLLRSGSVGGLPSYVYEHIRSANSLDEVDHGWLGSDKLEPRRSCGGARLRVDVSAHKKTTTAIERLYVLTFAIYLSL